MDAYLWWIIAFFTTGLILLTSLFIVLGFIETGNGQDSIQKCQEPVGLIQNIEDDPVEYAAELRRRSREAAGIFQNQVAHRERASHFPVPEFFVALKKFREILFEVSSRRGVTYATQERITKCIDDIGTKLLYNHVLVFFKAGIQLLDLALKEIHGEDTAKDVRNTSSSNQPKNHADNKAEGDLEKPQVWELAPEIFLVPSFDVMERKQLVSAQCTGIFFIPLADIIQTERIEGQPWKSPRKKYEEFVSSLWSRVEREIELLPPLPSKYKRLAWSRQCERQGGGRLGLTRRLYSTAESLKDKTTGKAVINILNEVLTELPAEKAGIQDWIESQALDEETLSAIKSMLEYKNC